MKNVIVGVFKFSANDISSLNQHTRQLLRIEKNVLLVNNIYWKNSHLPREVLCNNCNIIKSTYHNTQEACVTSYLLIKATVKCFNNITLTNHIFIKNA